ncbi:MAG TPA: response regulator transcription factor [Chitinophagaceae bacterium]|jgi:DNA-binding NarL/FixJ family response regulator
MISILIADPLVVARKGLKQIILEEFPLARIEEVNDPADIIARALQSLPDLVISDIAMPGHYGMEILYSIRRKFPQLPVLISSIYPEDQYAKRILKAGVNGYLSKRASSLELICAVRSVLEGKKYITPLVAEKIIHDLLLDSERLPHEALSNREFDILKLLACGRKVTEIAAMLSLSGTMIGNYRTRILAKLNLKSNAELISYATHHNLMR